MTSRRDTVFVTEHGMIISSVYSGLRGDGKIEAFQASCLGNQDMIMLLWQERERERVSGRGMERCCAQGQRSRRKWINGVIFTLWGWQSSLYFIFLWPLLYIQTFISDSWISVPPKQEENTTSCEMWMINMMSVLGICNKATICAWCLHDVNAALKSTWTLSAFLKRISLYYSKESFIKMTSYLVPQRTFKYINYYKLIHEWKCD